MTRPEDPVGDLPPADELDELASALLDGAAGADDLARAADPALAAELARRQARFDRVRAVLSEPGSPADAAAREAAVAAALAAADERDLGRERGAPATPDELAVQRSLRTDRRAAHLRVLGAAAAVLAVVALGAAVLAGGNGDDADTATDAASEDSTEESADGGREEGLGGDDAASPESGGGSAVLPVLGDLGDFPDATALLDAIGDDHQFETTDAASLGDGDLGDDGVARARLCAAAAGEAGVDDGLGVLVATATVDGEPVVVWAATDGGTVVVDLASCAVLADAGP